MAKQLLEKFNIPCEMIVIDDNEERKKMYATVSEILGKAVNSVKSAGCVANHARGGRSLSAGCGPGAHCARPPRDTRRPVAHRTAGPRRTRSSRGVPSRSVQLCVLVDHAESAAKSPTPILLSQHE